MVIIYVILNLTCGIDNLLILFKLMVPKRSNFSETASSSIELHQGVFLFKNNNLLKFLQCRFGVLSYIKVYIDCPKNCPKTLTWQR